MGETLGKQFKSVADQAEKYKIKEQAGAMKMKAYARAGVSEKTGDKVLKGVAVIGTCVKTAFVFKKTVAVVRATPADCVLYPHLHALSDRVRWHWAPRR